MNSNKWVIITGASAGIGLGFARTMAQKGYSLVLVARRLDRLEALAEDLQQGYGISVQCVAKDLAQAGACEEIFNLCREKGLEIHGLVNNAGLGLQRDLCSAPAEKVQQMLQVNVMALTQLTHFFLPQMLQQKAGFVLNIASTAAFQPLPYFAIYAATKAYVVSFSQGVYEEARPHGVLVSCLCPGPVHTEFQEKAKMSPRFFASAQRVEDVVRVGMLAIERRRALSYSSWSQAIFATLSSLAPSSINRKVAATLLKEAS